MAEKPENELFKLPVGRDKTSVDQGGHTRRTTLGVLAGGLAAPHFSAAEPAKGETPIAHLEESRAIDQFNFRSPGAGSYPRTLIDRAKDQILVTDFMSDAQKADSRSRAGALDSTTAILNALEYARRSGRRVRFPAGVYRVTQVLALATETFGLTLEGDGLFATTLLIDHNDGPGVRLNRSNGLVTDMTIQASTSRKEGASGTGSDICCGLMLEPPDAPEKACAAMTMMRLRLLDHPHTGMVAISHNQLSKYDQLICQNNRKHGLHFDAGVITGRTHQVYPGLITLINCWAIGNGGHGVAVGNPDDASASPVRVMLINCEFADNLHNQREIYSNDEVWTRGQNIVFDTCAFGKSDSEGAVSPTGGVRFSGSSLQMRNCRFVNTSRMVNLEDDPIFTETRSVLIDGHAILNNSHDPAIIHSGIQQKSGIVVNSYGQIGNVNRMFQSGLSNAIWNQSFPVSIMRKSTRQSVVNSEELVDDDELQIWLRTGRTYVFEAHIRYSGGAGNMKLAFVGPTGATVRWDNHGSLFISENNTVAISNFEITESNSRSFGTVHATRTASVRGVIKTGETPGLFRMRIAQHTANADATNILADSFIRVSQENAGAI